MNFLKNILMIMLLVLMILFLPLSCTTPETEKEADTLSYLLNRKKKDSSTFQNEKKEVSDPDKSKDLKEVSDPDKSKDLKEVSDPDKSKDLKDKDLLTDLLAEDFEADSDKVNPKNLDEKNTPIPEDSKILENSNENSDKNVSSKLLDKLLENTVNPEETKNKLDLETEINLQDNKIPRNITLTKSPKHQDKIRISWDQVPEEEIVKHYVVYKKSTDNAQFYSQLGIVLPKTCNEETKKCWIDNQLKNSSKKASTWFPLQRYLYRVASVGQDNKESIQSDPVEGYLLPKNHGEVLKDVWKTLVKSNENTKKITDSSLPHYIRHTERKGNLSGKFEKYRVIEQDDILHNYHYDNFQEYNYIILNGYLQGVRKYSSIKILNVNGPLTITGMYQAKIHFQNCEIDQDTGLSKNGSIQVDYKGTSQTFPYNDPMLDTVVIR